MAQRLLPSSVVSSTTSWSAVASSGSPTVIQVLDEYPISITDYARGTLIPYTSTETITLALASGTDPGVDTGFSLVISPGAYATSAGVVVTCTPVLKQSTTTIWTGSAFFVDTSTVPGASFDENVTVAVPEADAANISNFGTLRWELTFAVGLGTGGSWQPQLGGVYLELPDAGFVHLDIDTTSGDLKTVAAVSGNYLTLGPAGSFTRVTGTETTGALYLDGSEIKVHA